MTDNKVTTTTYGICPKCKEKGISRERRPNGNTMCVNGHMDTSKNFDDQAEKIKNNKSE